MHLPAWGGATPVPQSLNFSFSFDPALLSVEHDKRSGYDWIRYRGLTSPLRDEWEGAPMLPAVSAPIVLPPGQRVADLLVVLNAPVDFPEITPVPVPPQSGDSTGTWSQDPIYYQDGSLFPPSPQILSANESYREFRVASFVVLPFEWRGDTRTLRLYRTVDVKVRLEPVPALELLPPRLRPERRFSQEGFEISWLRENVINPEDLDLFYPMERDSILVPTLAVVETTGTQGFRPTDRPSLQGPPVELVIVTSTSIPNGTGTPADMSAAFQRLADWRTKTGRPSVVRTLAWIRASYPGSDDQEKIRNFLREAYSLWGTDYVILGGDHASVPSRITANPVSGALDPPTDWYYAALDGTWNKQRDPYFEWTWVGFIDKFPELWVGRIPARDAAEANAIVTKILTYERCPDGAFPIPSSNYYTRAILAAGLMHSGDWNPGPPADTYEKWRNGIFTAEEIKKQVLDHASIGFTSQRLYANLTGTVVTCPGHTLDCWDKIRAGVSPYPPGPYYTPQTLFSEINGNPGSCFFHMEHSNQHVLGGPVDPGVPPATSNCLAQGCLDTECNTWAGKCVAQHYAINNTVGHFDREWAAKLANGPGYFMGYSNGSLIARHELDSVAEALVRNPLGGAVAICGKATSFIPVVPSNGDHLEIPVNFFKNAWLSRKFGGVALSDALLSYTQGGGTEEGSRTLHYLGDPMLRAWSIAPTALAVTVSPTTLGSAGIKKFDVTVLNTGTGIPVANARVCLYRKSEIYATTLTKTTGVATFSSVLMANVTDTLHVYVTADNRLPRHTWVLAGGGSIETAGLTYHRHAWVDTLQVGTQTDFAEAGDQISVATELKANASRPAGIAIIAATPRVKATVKIGPSKLYDPARVFIGKKNANPPAVPDTFSLAVSEHGLRPEDTPTTNPGAQGVVWIWRDSSFLYHLKARYVAGEPSTRYWCVLQAEGGMDLVGTTTDPGDTVSLANGKLDCRLYADGTDDEVTFRAEMKDWVEWVTSWDTYGPVNSGQIATCRYRLKLLPNLPPMKRIAFTVFAGLYSDFFLTTHAPDLHLTFLDLQSIVGQDCIACGGSAGIPRWRVTPTLLNQGDAIGDSVEVVAAAVGTGTFCDLIVPLAVNPGAETTAAEGFEYCSTNGGVTFSNVTLRRYVNGVWQSLRQYNGISPWGHSRQPSSVLADPRAGGFRVSWFPPADTTGLKGYHVFMDSAGVLTKLRTDLGTHASQWLVQNRSSIHSYRFGIAAIDPSFTRGPIVWSLPNRTSTPERSGWPKRVLRGSANSITLVNLDTDSESEIVVGGKIISAWNGDGTSATSDFDGVVFDPYASSTPSGEAEQTFRAPLAAHDIDLDGTVEIVGAYGDKYVYCVGAWGGPYEWRKACDSQSGPTLADLDSDGDFEVVVNSFPNGALYVWRHNGAGYRCPDGTYVSIGGDSLQYNFAGVAVHDLDNTPSTGLEIVQPTAAGRVYAWKTIGFSPCNGSNSSIKLWESDITTPVSSTPNLSTPVVGRVAAGSTPMVFVGSESYYRVRAFRGTDGVADNAWILPIDVAGSSCDEFGAYDEPVATPALGDMHNPPDGNPEVVWPTWIYRHITTECPHPDPHKYDPRTHLALLYRYGSVTKQAVAADSLPLPGRREENYPKTVGQPILGDFDGDGKTEILAISNQGGLFAWEARWNSGTNTFTCVAEKGWPLVFNEQPSVAAVGNIDGENGYELVVATDDGYVHTYDLAGFTTGPTPPWSVHGHDARRTGNLEGGGSGPVQDPDRQGSLSAERDADVSQLPGVMRPGQSITYQIPVQSAVRLGVFDVGGRRVRRLVDETLPGGAHTLTWDGRTDDGHTLSNGVYFLRLEAGEIEIVRRFVSLR